MWVLIVCLDPQTYSQSQKHSLGKNQACKNVRQKPPKHPSAFPLWELEVLGCLKSLEQLL